MKRFKHWFVSLQLFFVALILSSCGGGDKFSLESFPRASRAFLQLTSYSHIPENGWWWDPNEGGSGYAIEVKGNQVFLAAFMYETNGASTWYVSTLVLQTDNSYAGVLSRYQGGQTLLGTYRSPTSATTAGATLAFTSPTSGTLQIQTLTGASRTITLSRFPISTPTAFTAPTSTFESGWWWNASQGGRGFFIEVQGSQAFVGAFMYDSTGQPTWYVSTATLNKGTIVSGPLAQYTNGQSITGAWRSPTKGATSAGTLTFNLTSPTAGSMTLPDNSTVTLTRFAFNPGGLAALPLMVDSLGNQVQEADFGGGDSGAAGADGSAGDGAPIPNAGVTLVDAKGQTLGTTTNAQGYYRLNIKGLTPPFVVSVNRADGTKWYSPSVSPVLRRGFVTINLTGLTDKVAQDVVVAAKVGTNASQLTPATLASSLTALSDAKAKLLTQLQSQIVAAGLDPARFDPVTTPYKAVTTDSYDKLLESVKPSKDPATGVTVIPSIVGTWYNFSINGVPQAFGTATTSHITLFANGDYMQSQEVSDPSVGNAHPGVEHGTYSWNSSTGDLTFKSCDVDSNGSAGIFNGCPGSQQMRTITVNNGKLTINGVSTLDLLTSSNPIVGTWYARKENGVASSVVSATALTLTFFENGDYVQTQAVIDPATTSNLTPSVQHGTYTWDQSTGAFTPTCPTLYTNPKSGLIPNGGCIAGTVLGTQTLTVSGNTLTTGANTFTRVTPY